MRKMIKKKTVWLAVAAVVLTAGMTIQSAMAYFTANASAAGEQQLVLGTQTEVYEEPVVDMTKQISVRNTGENDCYVRVRVIHGSLFQVEYSGEADAWTSGSDDYWYYNQTLSAGAATSVLQAKIVIPEGYENDFNVVVIQECAPIQYDASGNLLSPADADWNLKFDTTPEIDGEGADQS